MSYLKFDKKQLINLEYSLGKEVLRSNRAGSYACTTLVGCNTRKYHGLLVCPMEHLDGDRHVLLSTLDCTILQNESEFHLGIHKYQGDLYHPKGHQYIQDFQAEITPKIFYRVGGVRLMRESLLVEKEQQILIKYTLLEADKSTSLRFTPYLAFRNMHQLSKANLHANTKVKFIDNGVKIKLYDGYPNLHMQFSKNAEFVPSPDWYYNIEYLEEQRRGYDFKEDLYVPGFFEIKMRAGEHIIFSASTSASSSENLKRKFTNELSKRTPRNSFKHCLLNSAEQFIVKKEKNTEIVAGFPWFGAWGRDTFISLPGLTLSAGNEKACTAVLDTMVSRMKYGLFPNMGSDDDYAYNTVDASLWFFWAAQQYAYHSHSYIPVWKRYGKTMKAILKAYKEGTMFNIGMQSNGLIYSGEQGKALTWMDAVVNGKPVTPRTGMPVEINALWYNAVCFSLELAKKAEDNSFIKTWNHYPEKIAESFIKTFWDEEKRYLADVVDDIPDWSVRPNQVIATSLKYTPLTNEMIKSVLEVVKSNLLTPRGLRTLAPNDEKYIGVYEGNQEKRDMAYHQGTVWPWLLEHFCEGHLKIYGVSGLALVKKLIADFEPVMNEHGIGSVSEIYNGDPPHNPKGAISQAWSVAALLRIIQKIEILEEN